MSGLTFALILTAVAVIGGYAAGRAPDSEKSRKRFGVSVATLLLIAGVAAAMVYYQKLTINVVAMLSKNKFCYLDPSDMDMEILLRGSFISSGNWSGLLSVAVFALLCGWFALLCARTAMTRRGAVTAVALAGPLWAVGLLFGVCGYLGWWTLLQRFTFLCSTTWPVIITLIVTVLLLTLWTLYLHRSSRRGWRVLLIALGILLGSDYLCWGLAGAVASIYSGRMQDEAVKQGIGAEYEYDPPEPIVKQWRQADSAFRRQHLLFQLPWDNIHIWVKRPGVADKDMVTPEERKYTLQFFDTPEARQFYQSYWDYADNRPHGFVEQWQLDAVRGYVRFCCGRAALFGETGQTGKILPELVKAMMIDRQMLDRQPIFFGELVRIACRFVWCNAMVSLGPDNAQSANVYRQALDYLKSCRIYFPSEVGYYLRLLKRGEAEKLSVFGPDRTMYNAKGLSYALSIRVKMKDFATNGYHGEPLPWAASDYLQIALTKSQSSITMCTTAMALKLYRAETGKYPATLAELAPKYLDQIPVSPFPGHSLAYGSDGKDFTLTLTAPKGNHFKISSQKDY